MNEMNTIYLLASGVNRLVKLELLIRLPTFSVHTYLPLHH